MPAYTLCYLAELPGFKYDDQQQLEIQDDRESFDTIRALSPTRYRFRIVDANGRDIRHVNDANISANTNTLTPHDPQRSTRVACAETPLINYSFMKTRSSRRTRWSTTEKSAVYQH